MTIYIHEGARTGFWEEQDLRKAAEAGRFSREREPRYYRCECVDGPDPAATGYIAYCDPEWEPGDCRDPDHALEGPFPAPDRTQVKGDFRRWLAVYGPATGVFSLFE